jgi:hypothetical protein
MSRIGGVGGGGTGPLGGVSDEVEKAAAETAEAKPQAEGPQDVFERASAPGLFDVARTPSPGGPLPTAHPNVDGDALPAGEALADKLGAAAGWKLRGGENQAAIEKAMEDPAQALGQVYRGKHHVPARGGLQQPVKVGRLIDLTPPKAKEPPPQGPAKELPPFSETKAGQAIRQKRTFPSGAAGDAAASKTGGHAEKKLGDASWEKLGEAAMEKAGEAAAGRLGDAAAKKAGEVAAKLGEATWKKAGEATATKHGEASWKKAGEATAGKLGEAAAEKAGGAAAEKIAPGDAAAMKF